MPNPATKQSSQERPSSGRGDSESFVISHTVHPWKRYFARMIDSGIAIVIGLLILLALSPGDIRRDENGFGIAWFSLLVWIPIEGLLLSALGATPGKALLSTTVRTRDGTRPAFRKALARSIRVWFFGLGTGFHVIPLFTMAVGYRRLTKRGQTSWDEATTLEVAHGSVSPVQLLGIAGTILLVLYLVANLRAAAY